MAFQVADIVSCRERNWFLQSDPLKPYLVSEGLLDQFCPIHSGCWRGYHYTLEVVDGAIYLAAFTGRIKKSYKPEISHLINMEYLFGSNRARVISWFSGLIRAGEVVHGWNPELSVGRVHCFEVEKGVIKREYGSDALSAAGNNSLLKRFYISLGNWLGMKI